MLKKTLALAAISGGLIFAVAMSRHTVHQTQTAAGQSAPADFPPPDCHIIRCTP